MTTDLADLPPLAEAMTAADVHKHVEEIARCLGGKAECYGNVSAKGAGVQIYPLGLCGHGDDQFIRLPTWPEAITAARTWAATHHTVARDTLIRRLALAILDLTDQHGRCTEAMLRGRDFASADIREHHEAACARAGEMASGAPFRVELS
jgi:hypothetical protein